MCGISPYTDLHERKNEIKEHSWKGSSGTSGEVAKRIKQVVTFKLANSTIYEDHVSYLLSFASGLLTEFFQVLGPLHREKALYDDSHLTSLF